MILGQVFNPKAIKVHLESEEKDEVVEELIEQLVAVYPETDRGKALASVRDRAEKMRTGIKAGSRAEEGRGGKGGVRQGRVGWEGGRVEEKEVCI